MEYDAEKLKTGFAAAQSVKDEFLHADKDISEMAEKSDSEFVSQSKSFSEIEKHKQSCDTLSNCKFVQPAGEHVSGITSVAGSAQNRKAVGIDGTLKNHNPIVVTEVLSDKAYRRKTQFERAKEEERLAKLNESLKIKHRLADEFLRTSNFDNVIRICNEIIVDNYQDAYAHYKLFLAQNKCKDEQDANTHKELFFDELEVAITIGDENLREQCLLILYERACKAYDLNAYHLFCKLNKHSGNLESLTKILLNDAIKNLDISQAIVVFDEIIADIKNKAEYADFNYRFGNRVFDYATHVKDELPQKAKKYYENILSVYPDNQAAKYKNFILEHNISSPNDFRSFCFNSDNLEVIKAELLLPTCNSAASDEIVDLCMNEPVCDESAELINAVLLHFSKGLSENANKLRVKFTDKLIYEGKFSLAEKFNENIKSICRSEYYFNRVLISKGISNLINLVDYADVLLNYEDYYNAITAYAEEEPNKSNYYIRIGEEVKKMAQEVAGEQKEFILSNTVLKKEDLLDWKGKITKTKLTYIWKHDEEERAIIQKQNKKRESARTKKASVFAWSFAVPAAVMFIVSLITLIKPAAVFVGLHWGWVLAIWLVLGIGMIIATACVFGTNYVIRKLKTKGKILLVTVISYTVSIVMLAVGLGVIGNRTVTISSPAQMRSIANMPAAGGYSVTRDLDCTGIKIRTAKELKEGCVFDGNGHTIKNLTINKCESGTFDYFGIDRFYAYAGLFGENYGTIKNVILDSWVLDVKHKYKGYGVSDFYDSRFYAGLLCGSWSGHNNSIENCHARNCNIYTEAIAPYLNDRTRTFSTGIFVGSSGDYDIYNSTITDCAVNGKSVENKVYQ